jgi:phosphoglycolate phosphatase
MSVSYSSAMNPPYLLLFDVDGTLLMTGGASGRAMENVGRRLFKPDFVARGHITAGMLDHAIFAELMAVNQITIEHDHHERFRSDYIEELEKEIARSSDGFVVLPGVVELLTLLRKRAQEKGDVILGLLTGNYGGAIPIKFAHAKIDPGWFEVTAFAEDGQVRSELTAAAMQRYERLTGTPADPRRVIVIGDTPRDVACAKAHGCVAYCVATSRYSVQELMDAGADVAVKDLTDPTPLLSLLDARSS